MASDPKKFAVVTGASGLIGRGLVQSFLQGGWSVIGIDCRSFGFDDSNYHFIEFDLADIDNYPRLVKQVSDVSNSIHCLVNNAAIDAKVGEYSGSFEELSLEEWDSVVRLNLSAPLFLTQKLLPLFDVENGSVGKIINMASIYGIVPPRQEIYESLASSSPSGRFIKPVTYPVTKSGLIMLTKYLATYLGRQNFTVNAVAPGGLHADQESSFVAAYESQTPVGRMAKVEDVVGAVCYLSSSDADYVTGHVLAVDGGWTVW